STRESPFAIASRSSAPIPISIVISFSCFFLLGENELQQAPCRRPWPLRLGFHLASPTLSAEPASRRVVVARGAPRFAVRIRDRFPRREGPSGAGRACGPILGRCDGQARGKTARGARGKPSRR